MGGTTSIMYPDNTPTPSQNSSRLLSTTPRFVSRIPSIPTPVSRCQKPAYFLLTPKKKLPITFQLFESKIKKPTNISHLGGVYAHCLVEQQIANQGHDIYVYYDGELPNNLINEYIWYHEAKKLHYALNDAEFNIVYDLTNSDLFSDAIEEKILSAHGHDQKAGLIRVNLTDEEFSTLITSNGGHRPLKCIQQYLLINPLQNNQSNHDFFKPLLEQLPGYNEDTTEIIAGGKVEFYNSEIVYWNLKRDEDSLGSIRDQRQSRFKTNLREIFLPVEKYRPLQDANESGVFYSSEGRGSFQPHSVGHFVKISTENNDRQLNQSSTSLNNLTPSMNSNTHGSDNEYAGLQAFGMFKKPDLRLNISPYAQDLLPSHAL